jgi:drug/metabolite transporter (DMT)-like permease
MKTKPWAIFLVIFCTLLTASGQIFLKKGANILFTTSILTNFNLFVGLTFYCTAAVLLIIALKYGELSVLYPIIATSFIWVAILSKIFLGEIISPLKIVAIALIIVGVCFIGRGSR